MNTETETKVASGVEGLVDKLYNLGVQRGKEKEQEIVSKAKEEAARLVNEAQAKADSILANAKKEAAELEGSGKSALEVASRDAMLGVEQTMQKKFDAVAKRAVSDAVADKEMVKALILAVVGKTKEDIALKEGEKYQIVLPESNKGNDEDLQKIVNEFSNQMLKEGVEVTSSAKVKKGIVIKLVDRDLEVDLSDVAIAQYVLQYLRPRFREILESAK